MSFCSCHPQIVLSAFPKRGLNCLTESLFGSGARWFRRRAGDRLHFSQDSGSGLRECFHADFDKTRNRKPLYAGPFRDSGGPCAGGAPRVRGVFFRMHFGSVGGSPRLKMVARCSLCLNCPVLPHTLCRIPCSLNPTCELPRKPRGFKIEEVAGNRSATNPCLRTSSPFGRLRRVVVWNREGNASKDGCGAGRPMGRRGQGKDRRRAERAVLCRGALRRRA